VNRKIRSINGTKRTPNPQQMLARKLSTKNQILPISQMGALAMKRKGTISPIFLLLALSLFF
jgi:hypothetical protein